MIARLIELFDRGKIFKSNSIKLVTISIVFCLCLTSDWLPIGQIQSPVSKFVVTQVPVISCVHHEQTIAILETYPDKTITKCRLILAENHDQFDKVELLSHFSRKMRVQNISFYEMLSAIQICNNLEENAQILEDAEQAKTGIDFSTIGKGILPGTLWCGVNDIAEDFKKLGANWRLDKCCRAHDHCPVKVKALQRRYGVFNLSPYTNSHCQCDNSFYNCLKQVNSSQSNAVGDFFFNVIGVRCIEEKPERDINLHMDMFPVETKRKY